MSTGPSTIYVDLDGTLCPVKSAAQNYGDLPACDAVVGRLRQARAEGFRIVVFTARNMRTFAGDLSRINLETAPQIVRWLKENEVPHDGLIVGKPWPGPLGFYVDDRTVRPDEFVAMDTAGISALLAEGGQRP